jgi:predicted negative regulator of RcsB-dependent stress response
VPHYTRQQLKEDKFADAARDTFSWAGAHRRNLILLVVVVVIAAGVGFGGWAYLQHRNEQASIELSAALRILDARIYNGPPIPDVQTYPTVKDRANAARTKLAEIQKNYPYTRTAEVAKYLEANVAADAGDYAFAESRLKELMGGKDPELASLAKYSLVSVYRRTNRDKQAVDLLQELIKTPTSSVPKVTAQLELASVYEQTKQSKEAVDLYTQIEKDNPGTPAAQFAHDKVSSARPF